MGRLMLSTMNAGHAGLSDWGMAQLQGLSPESILEIGCGAGRNAGELLKKYPSAHVTAIDHAELSVERTRDYNRKAIEKGRMQVETGDVASLRLPKSSFDLATAFETVYFWEDLDRCFAQVSGVLRAGGCFFICNESDGTDAAGQHFEKIIEGMHCHTAEELRQTLLRCGFSDVRICHHPSRPWICLVATKSVEDKKA